MSRCEQFEIEREIDLQQEASPHKSRKVIAASVDRLVTAHHKAHENYERATDRFFDFLEKSKGNPPFIRLKALMLAEERAENEVEFTEQVLPDSLQSPPINEFAVDGGLPIRGGDKTWWGFSDF